MSFLNVLLIVLLSFVLLGGLMASGVFIVRGFFDHNIKSIALGSISAILTMTIVFWLLANFVLTGE